MFWLRNIVIMLAFCYESFNIVIWVVSFRNRPRRPARFKPNGPWPFVRQQHWPQVLLSLFCAIWTPLVVSFHPLIAKECLFGVDNIPNDYQLVYQIVAFIIAEYLVRLLFVRLYPLYSMDGAVDAHGLATNFTLQQATLLLAIMTIQGLSQTGINSSLGHVHITAIAGWIFFRQLSAVSKLHAFCGHLSDIRRRH